MSDRLSICLFTHQLSLVNFLWEGYGASNDNNNNNTFYGDFCCRNNKPRYFEIWLSTARNNSHITICLNTFKNNFKSNYIYTSKDNFRCVWETWLGYSQQNCIIWKEMNRLLSTLMYNFECDVWITKWVLSDVLPQRKQNECSSNGQTVQNIPSEILQFWLN